MDITKLINKRTGEENQIKKFEEMLSKTKTKKQRRDLEMHLLKPKPVPVYKGDRAGRTLFQRRTILLSFPKESCIEQLGKFFTVNSYIQNNSYDTDFLIELIRLMGKKKIRWNKHAKKFFIKDKNGKSINL